MTAAQSGLLFFLGTNNGALMSRARLPRWIWARRASAARLTGRKKPG